MKAISKANFKKELRKSDDVMLAVQQLSNLYPAYASAIMSAAAEVMAESISLQHGASPNHRNNPCAPIGAQGAAGALGDHAVAKAGG